MPTNTATRPSTIKTSNGVEVDLVRANVTSSIRMRNQANGNSTKGYLYSGEIATRLERATTKVNGTYWDKILKNDGTVGYVARCTYDYESNYKEYLIAVGGTGLSTNAPSGSNSSSSSETNNTSNGNSSIKGDVNQDGKITSSDYVLIKNSIMGTYNLTDKQKELADYNGDGKITSSDYVLIKNKIME